MQKSAIPLPTAMRDSGSSYFSAKMSKDYSWQDAEWLLGEWNGAACLKGVCRAEDATHAKASGFDAVWVSNHGGRQLETSPPTVTLLPAMRAAVGDEYPLIVDGGMTETFHVDGSNWRGAAARANRAP